MTTEKMKKESIVAEDLAMLQLVDCIGKEERECPSDIEKEL